MIGSAEKEKTAPAEEKAITDFSYFASECVSEVEGLGLKTSEAYVYQTGKGAKLFCSYDKTDFFSVNRSHVQIKYQITHTGTYEARTFADSNEADLFLKDYLDDLKKEGYQVTAFDEKQFLAKGLYHSSYDKVYPRKDIRLVGQNGKSVVIGSFDVYFYPLRSYQLDSSITEEMMLRIVKDFGNQIPFPQEQKVILFAEQAKQRAMIKEQEIENRDLIRSDYENWLILKEEQVRMFEKRKHFFSWFVCLVADGLGLNLKFLEKVGISQPYLTCGYILYEDVARSKKGEVPVLSLDDYLRDHNQIKGYCINTGTKALYRPRVEDWVKGKIVYDLDETVICPNDCRETEEGALCE